MKILLRILIGFIIAYFISFYFLIDFIKNDIRPRYLESIEESLNDTVNILASLIESDIINNKIELNGLKNIFSKVYTKSFSAKIFSMKKTGVNLHVYVTDENGQVLFDSREKANVGKDYSKWNDVYQTLRGKYGARSTERVQNDKSTTSLYVSAPIKNNGRIIGVVTVVKPTDSVTVFIEFAKQKTMAAVLITGAALMILSLAVSFWVNRPLMKLTDYVKSIKDHKRTILPELGRTEIRNLGKAFEEMREELEGRKYIEQYIQTLTHELKSPLSSIRGSAELLEDNMPQEQKKKFVNNILSESMRIENLIERLLQLSSLENRNELNDIERIDLHNLIDDVLKSLSPQITKKKINIIYNTEASDYVKGEKFLIRHAIMNLMENAIKFTGENGNIEVSVRKVESHLEISISDNGEGIPDYAVDKLFDKFYSLPGKAGQKKSTGLGLPFVREVANLHNGTIEVMNNSTGEACGQGVTAVLSLPFAG
jgi:two-component system, OmpR family, sensor histidine kinase CreC